MPTIARSLACLTLALAACREPPTPPAPTPAPTPQTAAAPTGTVLTAAAPGDAGTPGSGGDEAVILPLGYPKTVDAPAWTKRLVQKEVIDGEERLVAVGWATGIKSPTLAQSAASLQARTRLLRVYAGQEPDSTQPVEGSVSDTRVEELFQSKSGALFVKVSGPAKP